MQHEDVAEKIRNAIEGNVKVVGGTALGENDND